MEAGIGRRFKGGANPFQERRSPEPQEEAVSWKRIVCQIGERRGGKSSSFWTTPWYSSFREAMSLEFAPACEKRWEALALARWVIDESFKKTDSALGAVFNAANEVVVESFLAERLAFGRITAPPPTPARR